MKSVILFSGGLDSTVMLAKALHEGKMCIPLFFSYGQKHIIEKKAAQKIIEFYKLPLYEISFSTDQFSASALTSTMNVPKGRLASSLTTTGVSQTFVPARNTLFLAYAAGFAELHQADEIHFGCNALDVHNYPDCKPDFVKAFQQLLGFATKRGFETKPPQLITPLSALNKKEVYELGKKLYAPLDLTWSCYDPIGVKPCRHCDACVLRIDASDSIELESHLSQKRP